MAEQWDCSCGHSFVSNSNHCRRCGGIADDSFVSFWKMIFGAIGSVFVWGLLIFGDDSEDKEKTKKKRDKEKAKRRRAKEKRK